MSADTTPARATAHAPHPLVAALGVVDQLAKVTLIGLMALMITVVSVQVFLRYALNAGLGWADEVSRLAFVWSVFLAIPLGIREGLHIGIQLFTARLPVPVRAALARLVALAGVGLMLIVCYQSAIIAWDQWDEKMASVNASAALFVVAITVGSAHSALWLLCLALTGRSHALGVVSVE
jgi:TRAP-type C4-dicarboxylate transport system permease small subunit